MNDAIHSGSPGEDTLGDLKHYQKHIIAMRDNSAIVALRKILPSCTHEIDVAFDDIDMVCITLEFVIYPIILTYYQMHNTF